MYLHFIHILYSVSSCVFWCGYFYAPLGEYKRFEKKTYAHAFRAYGDNDGDGDNDGALRICKRLSTASAGVLVTTIIIGACALAQVEGVWGVLYDFFPLRVFFCVCSLQCLCVCADDNADKVSQQRVPEPLLACENCTL